MNLQLQHFYSWTNLSHGNFLPQEFLFGKSFEKFFYKKKMCNVVYRLGDEIFDEF